MLLRSGSGRMSAMSKSVNGGMAAPLAIMPALALVGVVRQRRRRFRRPVALVHSASTRLCVHRVVEQQLAVQPRQVVLAIAWIRGAIIHNSAASPASTVSVTASVALVSRTDVVRASLLLPIHRVGQCLPVTAERTSCPASGWAEVLDAPTTQRNRRRRPAFSRLPRTCCPARCRSGAPSDWRRWSPRHHLEHDVDGVLTGDPVTRSRAGGCPPAACRTPLESRRRAGAIHPGGTRAGAPSGTARAPCDGVAPGVAEDVVARSTKPIMPMSTGLTSGLCRSWRGFSSVMQAAAPSALKLTKKSRRFISAPNGSGLSSGRLLQRAQAPSRWPLLCDTSRWIWRGRPPRRPCAAI